MTAIAPIAWGSTYYVTRNYLPADAPLWGASLRALPAGLVLLAVRPRRPHGSWWWRSVVLGTLNMGAFFVLIYVAAQRLPTSVAAPIMASSPVAMMLLAWALLGERPRRAAVFGAGVGLAGVLLLLSGGGGTVDPVGVGASVAAMLMSACGYVLTKRWSQDADVIAVTAWQLVAGGLMLAPAALLVEGATPPIDGAPTAAALVYVSIVATAGAFAAWFSGLRHLTAGSVGLIGLLNPMTGVLLGTVVAAEVLSVRQLAGLALVTSGIVYGSRAGTRTPRVAPRAAVPCSAA